MATVPNTETFSLDDVVDVVNPTTDDLDDCFSDADDDKFDRNYEGNKDRLSNFRNYGWAGCLSYSDSEVIDHPLVALHGALDTNYYCFGAASDGYACAFQIDNDGDLYELNAFATNGNPVDIYVVSLDRIFVITNGYGLVNRSVLYSLQFNGTVWTELDNIESVYGGLLPSGYKYKHVTADPDNQFVFCSGDPNDDIIDVYSWDSSGNLTLEETNEMPRPIGDITWMSSGYLVVAFEAGVSYVYIESYSVNSSGVLSYQSAQFAVGNQDVLAIENNGQDVIIYTCLDKSPSYSRWYIATIGLSETGNMTRGEEGLFYDGFHTPPSYSPDTGTVVFLGKNAIYSRKIDNDYGAIRGSCSVVRNDSQLVYAGFNGAWAVVYTENGSTYTLHSYEIS